MEIYVALRPQKLFLRDRPIGCKMLHYDSIYTGSCLILIRFGKSFIQQARIEPWTVVLKLSKPSRTENMYPIRTPIVHIDYLCSSQTAFGCFGTILWQKHQGII